MQKLELWLRYCGFPLPAQQYRVHATWQGQGRSMFHQLHNGIDIICMKGRFGPYIKYGDKNVSLPRGTDPLKVDLDTCIRLIEESSSKKTGGIIHEFKESDIQVIDGAYGPYIKFGKNNYRIPKGTDATALTEEKCKEIINNSQPTGRKKKR